MTEEFVSVREDFLNLLLIESGFANPETLQKAISPEKPTFEPDPQLGEGIASKQEMEYRKQLMLMLKYVYSRVNYIISTKADADEKIKQVDDVIDDYIERGQKLAEKHVTDAYNRGMEIAKERMAKYTEDIDVKIKNTERLEFLIKQQKDNIEDIALVLRGRIRQVIRIREVMGAYGK